MNPKEFFQRIRILRILVFPMTAFGLLQLAANPLILSAIQKLPPNVATSAKNMVATVHPLATQAGIDALAEGGNAVDAAVAAGLMLGVVDGYNSGIGGGCFILIRTGDGKFVAIDGREMAPAAANRDIFLVDGQPDTSLSQLGALASGVPGALAAYAEAAAEHGRLPLANLIASAADVAENGFEISESYAERVSSVQNELVKYPGSRGVFFKPDGAPVGKGDLLRQTDLADTYRKIAEQGTDYFYRGEFAEKTAAWMKENGGIMTADDFDNYHTVSREPLITTYREYTIVGFPPPGSGGIHVAQILNILENFELRNESLDDVEYSTHVITEAMKLAFADRAYWLGDPEYADVPRGLIDKGYAKGLAARIDPVRAINVDSHGTPPLADSNLFERHTTHIATADDKGNWVAITTTVNTSFGSKVIVPGLGVVMNNQMDDFSIAPGTPNAFGLLGNDANSVQPGKRPLSSMSPTIVLLDGKPIMTVGAAGGPKIITQVVLAIVRHLDFGLDMNRAIGDRRFHQQWSPDKLYIENGFDGRMEVRLRSRGHNIKNNSGTGVTQAIVFDPVTGLFTGVHDPRAEGSAAGQ